MTIWNQATKRVILYAFFTRVTTTFGMSFLTKPVKIFFPLALSLHFYFFLRTYAFWAFQIYKNPFIYPYSLAGIQ
ncbi:hypothetical protein AWN65_12860 [Flavobacterium covae]|nr:hypothetical protein AWN65_12810 [Flavobacterium covae]AMA50287.1 hypothetical protein AWN65_12860 [Flavobacterium covae]